MRIYLETDITDHVITEKTVVLDEYHQGKLFVPKQYLVDGFAIPNTQVEYPLHNGDVMSHFTVEVSGGSILVNPGISCKRYRDRTFALTLRQVLTDNALPVWVPVEGHIHEGT